MGNHVFEQLGRLITESRNPVSEDIDCKNTEEILRIINSQDKAVPDIVATEIPFIARAVDLLVDAFQHGGRLFYIGAGTSGRLGVLDAAECPPTFGTDPEMIQGLSRWSRVDRTQLRSHLCWPVASAAVDKPGM